MLSTNRRGIKVFFLVLGISLILLAVSLQVGWILVNLQEVAMLVFGIIFFALIITGVVLNTTFLLREIRINEQQDAFLNAVTHELKTPIASIRLYLETLKSREVEPAKRAEFYDVMLADSDRLLGTVEQILVASRSREPSRKLNIAPVHLAEVLHESAKRISHRYHLSDDAINILENSDDLVAADYEELITVFTNLFDNAVKYSGENPRIDVSFDSTSGKFIRTKIRDNGIGISADELRRVFNKFHRVLTRHSSIKGTGLGLFIVRSIIERHGGTIFAESAGEEKGTLFTVQLPRA